MFISNTADLSLENKGCPGITSEAACVAAADNRKNYYKSPCHWCCGATCTTNQNMCEPKNWLLEQKAYKGQSRNGAGYDTCPFKGMLANVFLIIFWVNKFDTQSLIYATHSRTRTHALASTHTQPLIYITVQFRNNE